MLPVRRSACSSSRLGFDLITASVLAIAAVGFTLQFAVTNVLNLAYGAVMIVCAIRRLRSSTRQGISDLDLRHSSAIATGALDLRWP